MSVSKEDLLLCDTTLPCGLSTREIITSFGNNVSVYILTANVIADIRYTIIHRPKIAVFNNGGNQIIHTKILDAAGIGNYDVMDAADIANLQNCYTFVSEPHADSTEINPIVINAIRGYVLNGGNFLAQCHAVNAYENRAFFVTTAGIDVINSPISHLYPNADLAFSQMNGNLKENEGGSVQNWTLKNGSDWRPFVYNSVSHIGKDTVVALSAHLISPSSPGGNVFYLGGHDYSKGGGNKGVDLSTLERVNALRLYLNAVFVPSKNSSGAWANAGTDASITCDSAVLGCDPTGPPGSTFLWTPSAGLNCTSCPNPVARPNVTTKYYVQVTNGCIARDTVMITVIPKPQAKFINSTVCYKDTTKFTDQSLGSASWKWNFGDLVTGNNNSSSEQSPSHTFSAAGNFKVTLITRTTSCIDTVIQDVIVKALPIILVNSDTICKGESSLLTARGALLYKWSGGMSGNQITVSPDATKVYEVTGTDAAGCSAQVNTTVNVIPAMVPVISFTNASCFGENDGTASVSVTGGMPGYTYNWNTIPAQTAAKATNLNKGNYTVVIRDKGGCSDTASLTVNEPQPLALTGVSENVTCFGGEDGTVSITISGGTGPYTYKWNTDAIKNTPNGTGLKKGAYLVNVSDANGCEIAETLNITEPPATIHLITTTTNVKCYSGNDGTASVAVIGPATSYTYSWNTVPVQTTPLATGLTAGTYYITVKDSGGCSAVEKATVSEPPPFVVSAGPDKKLCTETDPPATLSVNNGKRFIWYPTGDTTQYIQAKSPGAYFVTAFDSAGCPAKAMTKITEVCPPRFFISNSFTPNGDGINDHYNVYGEHFTNFHMFIFNRWGEIIFESADRSIVWDGNYKQVPMLIGVYPWLITYNGDSEEYYGPYRLKGSVTVVR